MNVKVLCVSLAIAFSSPAVAENYHCSSLPGFGYWIDQKDESVTLLSYWPDGKDSKPMLGVVGDNGGHNSVVVYKFLNKTGKYGVTLDLIINKETGLF